ncbi:hypothetical protein [Glycomyces xiaoerkulensis]|uniref:hypothetical protein n=1 Tax=Glycomyces xiaoerkulensis TaxID=2038139 RepID=UPI000C25CCE9|nr:hypothetical protein [Glycomyces xiaoerkulensis]
MNHLDEMSRKIRTLRSSNAVDEMERRWDEEYADRYNDSRLTLRDPAELSGDYPGGLGEFFSATNGGRFGDIVMRIEKRFRDQVAVDAAGEPIDDRDRVQVGDVGEDALLLDKESGNILLYHYTYFKHGWDTGVLVECADVPEFIATVALGSRYREIRGPLSKQSSHWWEDDPWYSYLQESGMAE